MNLPTKVMLFACLAMMSFSCSTDNIDEDIAAVTTELIIPETKTIEIEILELINQYRIEQGLNTLNNLDIVKSQAFNHTNYMIEQDDISHDYFNNRKTFLVNNAGANKVSENVAYGYSSAQSVVNAWINSESHRSTMVGDYTDFEISAEKNDNGSWYFTNIFIKK